MDIDDPGLVAMLTVLTMCSVVWAAIREWQYRELSRSYTVAVRLLNAGGWLRTERADTHAFTVSGTTYATLMREPAEHPPAPPPRGRRSNRARVFGPMHPPTRRNSR